MSWYLRRVGAIVAVLAAGCSSGKPAAPHAEAPAHVESPRKEAELTTVKLSPEAVKRLGIEIVTVKTESAAATRSLGGEVTVPGRAHGHRHRAGGRHGIGGLRRPARRAGHARRPPDDARAARLV